MILNCAGDVEPPCSCTSPYCYGSECENFSNWYLSGMTTENTDNCALYGDVKIELGVLEIYLYRTEAKVDLMAFGSRIFASGAGEVTLLEVDSSGVSGTVDWNGNTVDGEIVLDCTEYSSSMSSDSSISLSSLSSLSSFSSSDSSLSLSSFSSSDSSLSLSSLSESSESSLSSISLSSESSDSSESSNSLESSDSSFSSDFSVSSDSSSSSVLVLKYEQRVTVYKDTGTVTLKYIYDGASYSPVKVADTFRSDGSELITSLIYGEKTGTSDPRKIWEIKEENALEQPANLGSGAGSLGEPMETVWQVRPGSITVLPVPHALPMSSELRDDVEAAIDEVKAAGVEAIIEDPDVYFLDIEISAGLNLEDGADEDYIKQLITDNLTNYINQLEQDEIAYWERLVAEANPDQEGLLYTEVISPSVSIEPPVGGFLRAGTISFAE